MRLNAGIFIPLTVVLANLVTFAIQLLVPRFLVPAEYATFATGWATGQFMASLCFEWIRFGVIRYSVSTDRDLTKRRLTALRFFYSLMTAALLVMALAAVLIGTSLGTTGFLLGGAILFYAVCQGSFDGGVALVRAQGYDRTFLIGWISRAVLSLAIVAITVMATGSGLLGLAALGLSYFLALLVVRLRGGGLPRLDSPVDRATALALARYGVFAAAGVAIANFLPALVRLFLLRWGAADEAGGVLLALDMSQKAILALGMAINIVLVRRSIRSAEFHDAGEQARQNALQISVPLALLLPATAGFYLVQASFGHYFVPPAYAGSYYEAIGWATLAAGLMAFRLYGLDPLFAVVERSALSIAGPAISILVACGWIFGLGYWRGFDAMLIVHGTVAGLLAGLIVSAALVWRLGKVASLWRNIAAVGLATGAMTLAVLPVQMPSPLAEMVVRMGVGGGIFLLVAVTADLFGTRGWVLARLRR